MVSRSTSAVVASLFVLLLFGVFPLAARSPSQLSFWGNLTWDTLIGEGDQRFRYGNWYGPGWWGGSERDKDVGPFPPVDALDAVAQKHDFGYYIAEKLFPENGSMQAKYKAIADAIAVKETLALPEDPRDWNPPAADPDLARKYVERIALGFPNYQERLNKLKAALPSIVDITDPEALRYIADEIPMSERELSAELFESLVRNEVEQWDAAHNERMGNKAVADGWEIDRASESDEARENMEEYGMICACEDWNRDGAFGVVIGKKIIHANYGPYSKCMELARALPVCRSIISGEPNSSIPQEREISDWSGTWSTSYDNMTLRQEGDKITGYYGHDNGRITGTRRGNIFEGTWHESGKQSGRFRFTLSEDGQSFKGVWGYGSKEPSSAWVGSRVE